ncbi:CHAT domain-containing protein [Aetokthonos hydrillicola Thurmond2011]|uniref:CHAT domain-containing protein n=1 Tax=Aetokthonos hydrillicola Thurmond2011 TaxID=2712845 RepID=A0AAP5IEQ4_9CYAN|nr:CHAT domain-containing protein [Aetokthonos hydrillicola]MBO3461965.1 CHAT domain-containing protein [Aetokthonos hydrillicola CCALA 1050]MBW4589149.1 CHAT domain-containing protein [Aetokthonos hydrillicola CCALA 1050]MDR9898707.1 CHAT domain-containing protein [Aetokthonos hydrillicola Thurmond2011]
MSSHNHGIQVSGGQFSADNIAIGKNAKAIKNVNPTTQPNNPAVKKILILASNPKTTPQLRLDEEAREIDAGLRLGKKREEFDLKQRWAVRVQDVYQALLDFKPQFVHFSGHGSRDNGLVLEDETGNQRLVDKQALASLFELFADNIECVVLNACYSEVQASAIAQHISYVIGMSKEIDDKAAIKFATSFYSALSSGESVEFAYKLACIIIQLEGIPEHLTPRLKKKQ